MGRTVAVIGGGYAGTAVAKALDQHADVILVEPKDAFVQNAVSMRALARPDWTDHLFFPYDRLLRRGTIVRDRAVSAGPGHVILASGERIDADHLVLATGSGYPFPFKPEHDQASRTRERLLDVHAALAGAARVLIAGAGPVGLELSGEIKAVWPGKHVTVVDPAPELLPGFQPELREDLRRQLDALGVDLRLGTALGTPPVEPGRAAPFTVTATGPAGRGEIAADIWFRAYGVSVQTGYLAGDLAAARTPGGRVRVTPTLNVEGHPRVYAIGDITDLPEARMAGNAMAHAEIVAANILADLRGETPSAVYEPSAVPFVLLPLGPDGGVGQLPSPGGPIVLPPEAVADYKGKDLFTGRFAELFGLTAKVPSAP
ncbi:NAD(P)/FAD-dependent oxidoreductase [Nonomuraea pusilla]|uniref:NADH dehydrogenase, FAD-containing subunit n=1 Tax=Nonomuraea pusilla TaxID=46177 RepID=A0A1H7S6H7_9ACTN|nr:FAD-dependent oxidoreductase [Nonomuraea pusilla]SEL67334.1 NADH dehydrogenase, FAD-containing subunit [Nonomuraea pusilla]